MKVNIIIEKEIDEELSRLASILDTSKSEIIRYSLKKTLPELQEEAKKIEAQKKHDNA